MHSWTPIDYSLLDITNAVVVPSTDASSSAAAIIIIIIIAIVHVIISVACNYCL